MRPALLLAALLVSGCLALRAPASQWSLDCKLGASEPGWLQPCTARTKHTPGSKAETWIAVNPTDPRNVVAATKDLDPAMSNKCVWVTLGVTHDAGATWKDVSIGPKYADRKPTDATFGWACNTDPMLAFSKDGTLHAIVEMYGYAQSVNATLSAGTRIVLYDSKDGGETWSAGPNVIAGDGLGVSPDYPRLEVSPRTGSVVASFIDYFQGKRCYVATSRDAGRSFEAPVILTVPDGYGCQALAIAPDGAVTVGDPIPGAGAAYIATSTDDARSFSAFAKAFTWTNINDTLNGTEFYTGTNFELAYAPDNTLWAIYADASAGDADVFVRKSLDHGRTWSEPIAVSHDASHRAQFMTALTSAPDGSLHAVYLDRRYDPGDKLVDATHAWSVDGGATWREERVTRASFDGDKGRHQDGYVWFGDYLGIDATANDVWMAFPDSGVTDVPTLTVAHAHGGES